VGALRGVERMRRSGGLLFSITRGRRKNRENARHLGSCGRGGAVGSKVCKKEELLPFVEGGEEELPIILRP